MLDGVLRKVVDPPMNLVGRALARAGADANTVTLLGLTMGIGAGGLVALGLYWPGLALMLVSRLLDGLDGAVARARGTTDFGGYLDITSDFLFYGVYPLGFIVADPAANAIAGAVLLTAFYFNGATFLGYAILAERRGLQTQKRGIKSLFFSGGLLEGSETIAFFAAIAVWPQYFVWLSLIFAALTFLTAVMRIGAAWKVFGGEVASEE